MKQVTWGVIGLGNIAQRFMKSLANSSNGSLYAVASQTPAKQEQFKTNHPNIHVYASYDALLDDPNVDAVYIALWHNAHFKWAKEAILKGKAVLCEKPATLSYEETLELCNLSRQHNIFFMEAMKTRFIPTIHEIKQYLKEDIIGDINHIETSFTDEAPYNPNSYLFEKEQGGALYDIGSYCLASILDYIHAPIASVNVDRVMKYDVDLYTKATLTFSTNQTAIVEVAIDRKKPKGLRIQGTKGTITAQPFYRPESAIITLNDGKTMHIKKPYIHDDFFGEIEEVHICMNNNQYESTFMSHQDSLNIIKILELIRNTK